VDNVGYNARAGNEILVHYLVDYALRKGEHEIGDDPGNLARATYAAYNGGPGHLARYRKPGTATSLKKIDDAFWAKYRAIQSEGASAVKRCLAG
jgi:soluble lytic murein transglycosylase-like protein